jgi:hypothetical protein
MGSLTMKVPRLATQKTAGVQRQSALRKKSVVLGTRFYTLRLSHCQGGLGAAIDALSNLMAGGQKKCRVCPHAALVDRLEDQWALI